MSSWRELLRPGGDVTTRVYEGVIAQDAANVNDKVLVTVLAFDEQLTWGPAPFMPRVDDAGDVELPQDGDRCVVLLAETDDPGEPAVWILGYDPTD